MQKGIQDLLSDLQAFNQTPESYGHDLRNDLADIIVKHLAERGWTQAKLAEMAGMKSPLLTRLIHSASNYTAETAGRIFYALGVRGKLVLTEPSEQSRTDPELAPAQSIEAILTIEETHGQEKYEQFEVTSTARIVVPDHQGRKRGNRSQNKESQVPRAVAYVAA